MVANTISSYREYRKRDKAIIELTTHAHDPDIQVLLVQCLNDYQYTIRRAQADPRSQELLAKMKKPVDNASEGKQEQLVEEAVTVDDKNDLVVTELVAGKRN
jgi:hypothetical protein